MAFPLPSHLPRKKDARDVSTQILTKISETSSKSLNALLVSSWVSELDETIGLTKLRIHERISSDLPSFERQLATSVSVQERLRSLSQNVIALEQSISSPESGLIPSLVNALTSHAELAQDTADFRAQHLALSHLLKCREELRRCTCLVENAELAAAATACASLGEMIASVSEPLQQSEVMVDMKRKCAALQNRTEEQLLDAYSRSVVVSESEIFIRPSVQAVLPYIVLNGVRARSGIPDDNVHTIITLSDLFASMSPSTLSMHLSTLRRDIMTHCIEYTLRQPLQIYDATTNDLTGISEYKLSFQRAPPNTNDLTLRLANFSTVLTFLDTALFPHFPPTERKSFLLSLCAPIRTSILNHLLLPNLPSSLATLPDFLKLTKQAVRVENEIVVKMLGDNGTDRSIKSWVDSVGLHYERKRRADILSKARTIAVSPPEDNTTFRVEVPLIIEEKVIPIQVDDEPVEPNGKANGISTNGKDSVPGEEDAWGFEDETPSKNDESPTDGWGFDDDLAPEPSPEEPTLPPAPEPVPARPQPTEQSEESDPGDAWGWDDDTVTAEAEDSSAWDDPWDEKPSAPPLIPPSPAPKQAKGLEKRFASKSVPNSPIVTQPPQTISVPAPTSPPRPTTQSQHPPRAAPILKPVQVTESYVVSERTKELLQLVEDVLREGAELVSSGLLAATGSPGSVIMQTAPMALELFRALVPVTNSVLLKQSAKEPMRFSNDCTYIGQELRRIVTSLTGPKVAARDKLEEGLERLKTLAESWFEETIVREEKIVDEMLDGAQGFIDTNQQDRFDECESAVNDVLRRIRRVAPQWKAVLTKSKYYEALGSVVETALSRILGDVLALEDITEAESHRLCELCHILNALEGLFVEDPEQPSFVVSYVPSWLKFSYLSELLEASIADISYLFEEGALVDFEIEELVKLVRALFADTPLRASTINKLQQGHPTRDF